MCYGLPATGYRYHLPTTRREDIPNRHNHAALVASGRNLPETRVRLRARIRVERCRSVDRLELHLVEQVVDLPAVLQLLAPFQANVLEKGEIVVVPARQ